MLVESSHGAVNRFLNVSFFLDQHMSQCMGLPKANEKSVVMLCEHRYSVIVNSSGALVPFSVTLPFLPGHPSFPASSLLLFHLYLRLFLTHSLFMLFPLALHLAHTLQQSSLFLLFVCLLLSVYVYSHACVCNCNNAFL